MSAPQAYITTSWDDGHVADLRVADLLSRYNLAGTFYIPRSIETGVMPVSQIRDLSARFEVGAHTLDHVFLTEVDLPTATEQIAGSKRWIENVTGQACAMFCPPAGKYDHRHVDAMASAGYAAFRTVEFMSLDHPRARTTHNSLLEMPTTLQAFDQPPSAFAKNAIKRRRPGNFWRYLIQGRASRDWTVLARRLLDRVLDRGGVFHLWGHSWEIQQEHQWDRLEYVFKLMSEVTDKAPCVTNSELCLRSWHGRLAHASPTSAALIR
jgi:hypothetical protein